MDYLLEGFNFITPKRTGRSGGSSFNGLKIKSSSRGAERQSITFKLSKRLMEKAGIVVGDRVNIGFKTNGESRHVFICRNPDGAYAVSAPAQYRGKHANACVKMALTDEVKPLDGFCCDLCDIDFLRSGGFIAND